MCSHTLFPAFKTCSINTVKHCLHTWYGELMKCIATWQKIHTESESVRGKKKEMGWSHLALRKGYVVFLFLWQFATAVIMGMIHTTQHVAD